MIFDVISGAISYRFDWTRDKAVSKVFNVPIGDAAVSEAKAFLNRLGAMPDDLNKGENQIKYLVATGSAMMPAASRASKGETSSDAQPSTLIQSISCTSPSMRPYLAITVLSLVLPALWKWFAGRRGLGAQLADAPK